MVNQIKILLLLIFLGGCASKTEEKPIDDLTQANKLETQLYLLSAGDSLTIIPIDFRVGRDSIENQIKTHFAFDSCDYLNFKIPFTYHGINTDLHGRTFIYCYPIMLYENNISVLMNTKNLVLIDYKILPLDSAQSAISSSYINNQTNDIYGSKSYSSILLQCDAKTNIDSLNYLVQEVIEGYLDAVDSLSYMANNKSIYDLNKKELDSIKLVFPLIFEFKNIHVGLPPSLKDNKTMPQQ